MGALLYNCEFFEIVETSTSAMVLQINNVLENMGLKFVFLHMSKMKGIIFHHDIYINFTYVTTLALGSRPKQGLARLRAKRQPENDGKCEGMNPHTPKGAPTLGV